MASGVIEVEVGDSDIDNLALTLLAPEEIHGRLDFDDEGAQGTPKAPPPRAPRRIQLRELNGIGQMKIEDVSEDGGFTIPNVIPGKYLVRLTGYLAYVKSVRLGETASEGPVLDLNHGSGGAALTVTVSSAYGEISGTVQNDNGPAAGARVELWNATSLEITANVASQADGTYRIQSVAPGKYKLLVVEESETHTITSEPGSDDFDERAETVEVLPKQTVTRDLKLRPL
jgi:uncharacterized surface anchored protein